MLVYRDVTRYVDPHALLHRLAGSSGRQLARPTPDREEAIDALVEFGEIESAITDGLSIRQDGFSPAVSRLRDIAQALGHLFYCSWHGMEASAAVRCLPQRLHDLRKSLEPGEIPVRTAEGFAFYGLHPASYLLAAEQFAREYPQSIVECIGLRTIGTALSAVVAATLVARGCRVRSCTMRPRGDPFARQIRIDGSLFSLWSHSAALLAHFLIIDEGPGLSGSSMCSTADELAALGVPDSNIHLFPSWNPDPEQFISGPARARWHRHRRFLVPFETRWGLPSCWGVSDSDDVSAGAWRRVVHSRTSAFVAAQPQHERRKYFSKDMGALIKFAGFGPYGREKFGRAAQLSDYSWTPPLLDQRAGFVAQRFVPGKPLSRTEIDTVLIDHAARYFAHLQRTFSTNGVTIEPLEEMARTNIRAAMGDESIAFDDYLASHVSLLKDLPAVALDGRVQPHEWIRTHNGILKVDALDHHADHFYPGVADIAWDLAGFACEFNLDGDGLALLADRFRRHGGDPQIGRRLPLYAVFYAAFRVGYSLLARDTLGHTSDGLRFARLADYYSSRLRLALAGIGA